MRRLFPMLALLLAYIMTPAAFELTESAIHLLSHADTAHAEDHAPDSDEDEHGCSGTYHACTCHSSPQFVDNSASPRILGATHSSCGGVPVASLTFHAGFARDIDRPPQA